MKQVYILFWRLYDPYGCLEDNDAEILGVFTTEEEANKNKEILKQKDTKKRYDYWVDSYELNKLEN